MDGEANLFATWNLWKKIYFQLTIKKAKACFLLLPISFIRKHVGVQHYDVSKIFLCLCHYYENRSRWFEQRKQQKTLLEFSFWSAEVFGMSLDKILLWFLWGRDLSDYSVQLDRTRNFQTLIRVIWNFIVNKLPEKPSENPQIIKIIRFPL